MNAITCINCGVEGVLKVFGLENDGTLHVFRRLGRNHISGQLHYQCPACKIVLLVDPALIRESIHIFKKMSPNYPLASSGSSYNLSGILALPPAFLPASPFSGLSPLP